MKGLLLAFISFILFMGVYSIVVRVFACRASRSLFFPLTVSIAALPIYIVLYWCTPADIWGLPMALVTNRTLVDVFNGMCVYLLLCIGFNDFLIAAVTQPFSTDLLILIATAGEDGTGYRDLLEAYSDAAGLKHIFHKRFDFLVQNGYILLHDNQIFLTEKGTRMAKWTNLLERFC